MTEEEIQYDISPDEFGTTLSTKMSRIIPYDINSLILAKGIDINVLTNLNDLKFLELTIDNVKIF